MISCFIGLGSNLSEPKLQLDNAVLALKSLPTSQLMAVSSYYSSRPMGGKQQPIYLNAVAQLDTLLDAYELLAELQHIEQTQGRVRTGEHWGPRTLDLDMLLYGKQRFESETLTVPHYGMTTRDFVLVPLKEIAPDLILPNGKAIDEYLALCDHHDLIIQHSPSTLTDSL